MENEHQIALLGHPVLRVVSLPVEIPTQTDVGVLVDDLFAKMNALSSVGLAAPQLHRSVRVFVMRSKKGPRFPNAPDLPPFEVINPQIVARSSKCVMAWEGCASVPGYRAMINRPIEIVARWYDRHGGLIENQLTDLAARVFLHECDHLDGTLFLDRMQSIADLVSEDEMLKRVAASTLPPICMERE